MTKIEWCDESWNPVSGCSKYSPGCANCWAEKAANSPRLQQFPQYQKVKGWDGTIEFTESQLSKPAHWKKPRKIFVCSMSDLFHDNVEPAWHRAILDMMLANPRHTYLLLTKRPANMEETLTHSGLTPQPNIWLGCTVENRHEANRRLKPMRQLAEAGWTTWVSYEPALELVDFTGWEFLDWLVIGGESGSNARSFHSDWARSVIAWCRQNEVAPFMKQMGSNSDLKVKGKGGEMSEWPEELRVREWPND